MLRRSHPSLSEGSLRGFQLLRGDCDAMRTAARARYRRPITIQLMAMLMLVAVGGCSSLTGTPMCALNCPDLVTPRNCNGTVDLSLLQTPPATRYSVYPGDVLGVYIRDAFGSDSTPGPVNFPIINDTRYPGQVPNPQVGTPVTVNDEGQIILPDIAPITVSGLTLMQVADRIRTAYVSANILKAGRDYVNVTLINPRRVRVTVFREDVDATVPTQVRKDAYLLNKRGTAQVLEMPGGENDVLHALAASGGLPGTDAYNHVWVIRAHPRLHNWVHNGFAEHPPNETEFSNAGVRFVRIPLSGCPTEQTSITPDMVQLNDGDVVYIEARKTEFFYVGGLLPGGQIPLPRDYDLDILGAISMANGNVLGPTGNNSNNFVAGPGNVLPPTRALVSRKGVDGSLSLIEVDLRRALYDPRERLIVRAGDVVMLKYRLHELVGNIGLNFVNFNFAIPNGQ